jgi:cytochrome c peroxidase
VRNVALTAPYMHNGVYRTLEEVVDFYNDGGGAGLGLDVPNQTLPADKLNLDDREKKALVAFMKALTDASAAGRAGTNGVVVPVKRQ